MKKTIIYGLIIIVITACALYLYKVKKSASIKSAQADDIAVFFKHAQEELPKLALEITNIEKETPSNTTKLHDLKEQLKTFKIVSFIKDRDIESLKKLTAEELTFKDGQIWVDGNKFKDTMGGKLTSRILGGENAIPFVLFHSILDTTEQDREKTLAMLKILFEKQLNPHTQAGLVYWLKSQPSDTHSHDYVALFSLPEIATEYSFPAAQKLLLEYAAQSHEAPSSGGINIMKHLAS